MLFREIIDVFVTISQTHEHIVWAEWRDSVYYSRQRNIETWRFNFN
jgi:hypothetical protein